MAANRIARFYARHPLLYRLSLAGAGNTLAYSIRRVAMGPTRRIRIRYGLLAALVAVELAGLVRMRPVKATS